MSTVAEPVPADINAAGWRLRRADARDAAEGAPEPKGWVYEHEESGLKTPVMEKPGDALKAAHRLEEARLSGQLGGDAGAGAAGDEGAPADAAESVPRPAADSARWRALAREVEEKMGTVNRARLEARRMPWPEVIDDPAGDLERELGRLRRRGDRRAAFWRGAFVTLLFIDAVVGVLALLYLLEKGL